MAPSALYDITMVLKVAATPAIGSTVSEQAGPVKKRKSLMLTTYPVRVKKLFFLSNDDGNGESNENVYERCGLGEKILREDLREDLNNTLKGIKVKIHKIKNSPRIPIICSNSFSLESLRT